MFFLTDDIFELIVTQTNIYASQQINKRENNIKNTLGWGDGSLLICFK